MYERSAIVLERCFERLFKFNQENNLKENYEAFCDLVEQQKDYQKNSIEEETIIEKFDEITAKIENIQKEQTRLHESNMELEQERDRLFNDVGENPNALDSKLRTIERSLSANNEKIEKLRQEYVEALVIFVERQKERNKFARLRRKVEANQLNNVEAASRTFESIDVKDVHAIKRFITADKSQYKERIVNTMIKNGKNEKIPFNTQVIQAAVEARIDIAEVEADIYISIYERMKRFLMEIETENIKLAKSEKMARDAGVKLHFLQAKKDYIVGFLDNERLTAMNGEKTHNKIMEQACKDFKIDINQMNNLYELIIKETNGKSTKKAYNELYNKTYLRDIELKERKFEREITGIKINIGTVINSSYWRIEGIKNVYNVFQDEVTEKFNKDLSEYKIEELPEPELELDPDLDLDNEFTNNKKSKLKATAKPKKVKEYDDDYDADEDDLYKNLDDFDFGDDDDDEEEEKFEAKDTNIYKNNKKERSFNFDDEEDDEEETFKPKQKNDKFDLDDYDDDEDDDDFDDFDDDYDDEDNDDDFEDIIEDDDDDFDYSKYDKGYSEGYKEDYNENYNSGYDDDDEEDDDDYDTHDFFDNEDDDEFDDDSGLDFGDDDEFDDDDDFNSYDEDDYRDNSRAAKRRRVDEEFFDEKIDKIIMKSRQKLADKQEARKDKGLFNKLFKKK